MLLNDNVFNYIKLKQIIITAYCMFHFQHFNVNKLNNTFAKTQFCSMYSEKTVQHNIQNFPTISVLKKITKNSTSFKYSLALLLKI